MSKQYFVKVITDSNGEPIYFSVGMDKHCKCRNVETSLSDVEYVSTTCYNQSEFNDYREHVNELMYYSKAKLSIVI